GFRLPTPACHRTPRRRRGAGGTSLRDQRRRRHNRTGQSENVSRVSWICPPNVSSHDIRRDTSKGSPVMGRADTRSSEVLHARSSHLFSFSLSSNLVTASTV